MPSSLLELLVWLVPCLRRARGGRGEEGGLFFLGLRSVADLLGFLLGRRGDGVR